MESNETENVLNEDVEQQDGLQLVKDINKYLRKALKKIETIQRNSDQLQQDASIQIQNNLQDSVNQKPSEVSEVKRKGSSVKRLKGTTDDSVPHCSSHNCINSSSEVQGNLIESNSNSQDEAEPDEDAEPDEEAESDQEIEPGGGEDLENNGSDSDCQICETIEMPLPIKPCIVSKLETPTNFLPLSVFYKAFLTNLPLTINVPKLKAWLESKGVSNYEDIIIYTKQTYKTSIVSYYDKNARDRLLLLDGELYDNWPIKVRLHVDRFTPEVDRLASTKGQKRKH